MLRAVPTTQRVEPASAALATYAAVDVGEFRRLRGEGMSYAKAGAERGISTSGRSA